MVEVIAKRWFAERCACTVAELKTHGWVIRSGGLTDEVRLYDVCMHTYIHTLTGKVTHTYIL